MNENDVIHLMQSPAMVKGKSQAYVVPQLMMRHKQYFVNHPVIRMSFNIHLTR